MPETTEPSPLLAIGEVARLLAVSIGTVRNWERSGKLAAIRTPSGQRRFRRSDVQAILNPDTAGAA